MTFLDRKGLLLTASLIAAAACSSAAGGPTTGGHPTGGQVGGASGTAGAGTGGSGGSASPQPFEPPAPTLRRLLAWHYVNAVHDLLGDAAAAAANPPLDSSLNGFDAIGAAQLAVGDDSVAQYESSAIAIATAAMGDMAQIGAYLGCTPSGPGDVACHKQFIANFGRAAWRRQLDAEELDRYTLVALGAAGELGDFYAGIQYAMTGLLQSPNFIYLVEIGEPFPGSSSLRRLTGYEMASRMSFFLRGTTPTPDLLDAAEGGSLETAGGVRAAATAMIATPEARAALEAFYGEFFQLRDLDGLAKDTTVFPEWSPTLAQEMRQETLGLIDDVVWTQNGDYRDILDAEYTFVNPDLAAFYGVSAPATNDFEKVPVPAGQKRGGFLGQASFLSLFAHVTTTSPTLRGKFVRERLLCQTIPSPPNNVNTTLPPDTVALTMRDKLLQHQTDPSCAGCHVLMDDIGFGLENYDGVGAFRTTENGVTIDTSAAIDGIGTFDGAEELGALLRSQPVVGTCTVQNLLRAATGHVETAGEAAALDTLGADFASSGYHLQDFLVELVASDAFRRVGALD